MNVYAKLKSTKQTQSTLKTHPKLRFTLIFLLGTLFSFSVHSKTPADSDYGLDPNHVAANMQSVADWQIEHFRALYSKPEPHHIRDWTNAALYVGMLKWARLSNDEAYMQWLVSIAQRGDWELHWRRYMADDHAVGQLYLDLYRQFEDESMMLKTKERLDFIMQNPSTQPITLDNYKHLERWTWCDALFMAPPVWAKMSNITNDAKYTDWMMDEFKATTDHLYDAEEGLYYRDNSYIGKLVNGEKVFWARGNGWVYAGLVLLMDELSPDSPEYAYFKDLYLRMTKTILAIQTPEGHWAMSLLNAKTYPTPETSGTSFFLYGLAWGVNQGLLEKSKVMPAIASAYYALDSHITDEGMLGYVQPIGAAPGKAWPDKSEVYGTGAFLAASTELYTLLNGQLPIVIKPSEDIESAIAYSNALLDAEYENK
jgi:rhamnogalacturonyl hydrolase YesR